MAQSKNPIVNRVGKDMIESTQQFDQEISWGLITGIGLSIAGACLTFISSPKKK
jgi:hypothetical protein